MMKVSARGRTLAAAGAVLLALLVAVLLVPWLEVREIEQRPAPVPEAVSSPAPAPVEVVVDPARGRPVRVRIEAIGVDATVLPVALSPEARLVPPNDVDQVGWWQGGARPGSRRGAVVLAGHSVRLGDGVFDDLADLVPGDEVVVTTENGTVAYVVADVVDYASDQLTSLAPQLFGRDVASQLTMVTCSGFFAGDYHTNTVVIAHPQEGPK